MNRNRRNLFAPAVLVLALAAMLIAACGPKVIRGRPPFVNVSGLNLANDTLHAEFGISNQNGVPMTIRAADFSVSVRETELVRYAQPVELAIDANSTEDVRTAQAVEPFTRTLLVSLDNGELASLAFDLAGSVETAGEGTLRFEYTGYLYPVPGRPGYYRAAVTEARELLREDPF